MADTTGISWCDATFNPWVGCEKVSPGCANCYAETLVTGRMGRPGTWGRDGIRERTSESNWRKPIRWNALAAEGLMPDGSENRDGHRPRIFCASLADVFEPRPELDTWRHELFDLIETTPNLDWLVLTKRPEVAAEWAAPLAYITGYSKNLWMGVSIENARHTYRADVLRQIPAAVRFISAEPLLGSLYPPADEPIHVEDFDPGSGIKVYRQWRRKLDLNGIDWVIVGGESGGRHARPMHPQWAREIRDEVLAEGDRRYAQSAGCAVPVECEHGYDVCPTCDARPALHFKQWGSYAPSGFVSGQYDTDDRATKEFADGWKVVYYGSAPKSAGKMLDGVEWCEFPTGAGALTRA